VLPPLIFFLPFQTKTLAEKDYVPLADVVLGFKQNIRKPLIGRVQKKTRLFHYGKRTDQKDAYPMSFSFVICEFFFPSSFFFNF